MKRCVALVILLAAAGAQAQVYLHGRSDPLPGSVQRVGVEGVLVQVKDAEPTLVSWDVIRQVEGPHAAEAGALAPFPDHVWRARARLERGDYGAAEPMFEALAGQCQNAVGPTPALVYEGLLRCRLRRGAELGALAAWLDFVRASGVPADRAQWRGGQIHGESAIDPGTDLAPALPPMWVGMDLGGGVALSAVDERTLLPASGNVAATAAGNDAVVRGLATWYLAAASFERGTPVTLPAPGPSSPALDLISQLVLARIGDEKVRAHARAELLQRLTGNGGADADIEPWQEVWCRVGIGRSLLRETDENERLRGVVELLSVPARFSSVSPAIAGWCLAESAAALDEMGDAAGASTLKGELRRVFPNHPALNWSKVRAVKVAQPGTSGHAEPDNQTQSQKVVDDYLANLNLNRVLAADLEEQLQAATKTDRLAIAERLAKLYVELLNTSTSPAELNRWESRGQALLKKIPEADSSELRLDLARAMYTKAEEVAERNRLYLATDAEVSQATATFRELAQSFGELTTRLNVRVLGLEHQVDASNDNRYDDELVEARRLRSISAYYAGWSNVYLATLTGDQPAARQAMRNFGMLLDAAPGRPATVDSLPTSLLRYEHIDRAIIGCAMAACLRGDNVEAGRWLDAVADNPEVPAVVRQQFLPRRVIILAAGRRWWELDRLITRTRVVEAQDGEEQRKATQPLSPRMARLVAVLALEAKRNAKTDIPELDDIAKIALADLIARKEAAQVLDLVKKFGTAPIGDTGFIPHYVRAVQAYDQARTAHAASDKDTSEPTTAPATANLYQQAGDLFEAAIQQRDAGDFASERALARVDLGLCRFYTGEFVAASEEFVTAWQSEKNEKSKNPPSDDPLWMAVLALDHAVRAASTAKKDADVSDLVSKRNDVATLFLQNYPNSPRAPRIVLMQAASGQMSDDEALKRLAAVGKDSSVYEPARRQMTRILYGKYRAATPTDRTFAATRFLAVAEEVVGFDREAAMTKTGPDAKAAAERIIASVREMLDVLLGSASPDAARAAELLTMARDLAQSHAIDLLSVEPELLYRDLQIAMDRQNQAGAFAAADRLWSAPDHGGAFGAAGDRLVYRDLANRWNAAAPDGGDRLTLASLLIKFGERVIDRLSPAQDALRDPAVLNVYSTVADAAMTQWRQSRQQPDLDLETKLDRALLAVEPRLEPALRRVAEAAESTGDTRKAIECWSVLAGASTAGTPRWFESRTNAIRLLATIDPERARSLLEQQKSLYPNFAPEPWGTTLRKLDAVLHAEQHPSGGANP